MQRTTDELQFSCCLDVGIVVVIVVVGKLPVVVVVAAVFLSGNKNITRS